MAEADVSPTILKQIAHAIGSLRYGTVQVTVHDAQVVQIEKLEKVRITPAEPPRGSTTAR